MKRNNQMAEGRAILLELWQSLNGAAKEIVRAELIDYALTLLTLRAAIERKDPLSWKKLIHEPAPELAKKISTLSADVLGVEMLEANTNNTNWAPPKIVAHLVSVVSDPKIGENPHADVSFTGVYRFLLEQSSQYVQPDFVGPPPPTFVCYLISELLRPCRGSAYDPCARSGQLLLGLDEHQQTLNPQGERLKLYGQENNPTRWRQAHEQALIRGTSIDLGKGPLDQIFGEYIDDGLGPGGWWFRQELHPGLKCNFAVCYAPADLIDYGLEYVLLDPRWEFGPGIPNPTHFAWLQLAIHHLEPGGTAAVVLSDETLSSNDPELARVRRNLLKEGIVRCIIRLPSSPELNNANPTALWVCSQKDPEKPVGGGDLLKREVLLINLDNGRPFNEGVPGAFGEGCTLLSNVSKLYRQWRKTSSVDPTNEAADRSVSVSIAELLENGGSLTPDQWLPRCSTLDC